MEGGGDDDKMVEVGPRLFRTVPDLMVLLLGLFTTAAAANWFWRSYARSHKTEPRKVRFVLVASVAGVLAVWALLVLGFMLRFGRVQALFPSELIQPWESLVIIWTLLSLPALILLGLVKLGGRLWPGHSLARRRFLRTSSALALGVPVAAMGYGIYVARYGLKLREQKIVIPGLPEDLHGLTLVQLTDIHLGAFVNIRQVQQAVAIANETRAKIALVTGDLITVRHDPWVECLNALAPLRAEAGVFGCMGNHELYAAREDDVETEGARKGIQFLRSRNTQLRFGNATLNLAGVDYQAFRKPYLVGAENLVLPGAFNLLLSHNPDVFPVAAQKGFPLTIGGHTHGGQVRVEILGEDLNVARFFTPYVDGLYREGSSAIFVSRGIGTIGIPARLGAPPEVALITLARG